MPEILIRKVGCKDEIAETQKDAGTANGYFKLIRLTGCSMIERVYEITELERLRDQGILYKIESLNFTCTCKELNYRGYDIEVCLNLRVNIESTDFVNWLEHGAGCGAWNEGHNVIYAAAIETYIQRSEQIGLHKYIRDCCDGSNLKLLQRNGAASWQRDNGSLGVAWLNVVNAESVRCTVHVETDVKTIQAGTVLCKQYRLVEKLGQGAFGQVWKAEVLKLQGCACAIKILAENGIANNAETIRNEAKILSRFVHNNIVNMRGYHEDGNVSFMVMDYIDGCSLTHMLNCSNDYKLDEEDVRKWLKPVAEAIDYVHSNHVVHRDIKPSNIIIGYAGGKDAGGPESFLCDFGIAHDDNRVTVRGVGTIGFLAPEVVKGGMVTAAADVYSFAVTVLCCLTGKMPEDLTEEEFNQSALFRSLRRGLSEEPKKRPEKCIAFFEEGGKNGEIPNSEPKRPVDSEPSVIVIPEVLKSMFVCLNGLLLNSRDMNFAEYHADYLKLVKYPDGGERTAISIVDWNGLIDLLKRIRIDHANHKKNRQSFFNEADRENLSALLSNIAPIDNQAIREIVGAIRNCIQR